MLELIRQFGVDWKLLLAQVVNFFILLFILKRFAYGPIVKMLALRRQKIKEGMEASDAAKKELANAEESKRAIILAAEQESVGIVSKAEDRAGEQAQEILKLAVKKSDHLMSETQKKLEEEKLRLDSEVEASAHELIKKGLVATLHRMKPAERDEMLITEALHALKTAK